LQAGDVLTVNTGGGGGYGSPTRRAGDRLDDDIEQGRVSPESATAVYGTDIEAAE
jgi:N-methylhydantoinase B